MVHTTRDKLDHAAKGLTLWPALTEMCAPPLPDLASYSLEERSFIQRCLRTTLSSPCIEMIGVCSGMVTAWYLWKSDGRGKPDGNAAADGGCRRVALSERVARGVPLLVATGWVGVTVSLLARGKYFLQHVLCALSCPCVKYTLGSYFRLCVCHRYFFYLLCGDESGAWAWPCRSTRSRFAALRHPYPETASASINRRSDHNSNCVQYVHSYDSHHQHCRSRADGAVIPFPLSLPPSLPTLLLSLVQTLAKLDSVRRTTITARPANLRSLVDPPGDDHDVCPTCRMGRD